MPKSSEPNTKPNASTQVRDQDGVAQGPSGQSAFDPKTHARGQGAHDYSKQGPMEGKDDGLRGKRDGTKTATGEALPNGILSEMRQDASEPKDLPE